MTTHPPTDAEKLLAVCRAVFGDKVQNTGRHQNGRRWVQVIPSEGSDSQRLCPDSLDDFRRVLLALTPGQAALFNGWMERLIHDGCGLTEHEVLTAPTSTILDALHLAVCPK